MPQLTIRITVEQIDSYSFDCTVYSHPVCKQVRDNDQGRLVENICTNQPESKAGQCEELHNVSSCTNHPERKLVHTLKMCEGNSVITFATCMHGTYY